MRFKNDPPVTIDVPFHVFTAQAIPLVLQAAATAAQDKPLPVVSYRHNDTAHFFTLPDLAGILTEIATAYTVDTSGFTISLQFDALHQFSNIYSITPLL